MQAPRVRKEEVISPLGIPSPRIDDPHLRWKSCYFLGL